jgi:hypothetical protein
MNMRDYPTYFILGLIIQKTKDSAFIAVQHFSHSRLFNNKYNSYSKMCVTCNYHKARRRCFKGNPWLTGWCDQVFLYKEYQYIFTNKSSTRLLTYNLLIAQPKYVQHSVFVRCLENFTLEICIGLWCWTPRYGDVESYEKIERNKLLLLFGAIMFTWTLV